MEHCENLIQTITKGSQYQASFLPEMKRDLVYKVKVEAKYLDYVPLVFDLDVKYLSDLDAKIKFVDLGTLIFTKSMDLRPTAPF
jgi:hypothetical protein